eukprot:353930-Chlamydomonas_euryale.AAC.4
MAPRRQPARAGPLGVAPPPPQKRARQHGRGSEPGQSTKKRSGESWPPTEQRGQRGRGHAASAPRTRRKLQRRSLVGTWVQGGES